eukprot:CAMPEP_0174298356 /NCGR_PEP_ID=MMETSP0809-20121228/53499_1 /TAXON_ID=73025 ORGANISM="Eutreptiella gymnastica-like, Strain CCMP1594" /NCGR_SAMPLE_ID=MMETSP0809 /ASSEMBLY_ACC=CAM_ASM_000658 /LENGTH=40 /DNA_ID= /DNA_START= /DNA_END= /DNA_ORIENTATION=
MAPANEIQSPALKVSDAGTREPARASKTNGTSGRRLLEPP